MANARIQIGEEWLPLDGYAPLLYDPKRVAAAAAGVSVRNPVLPLPRPAPTLSPSGPEIDGDVEVSVVIIEAIADDSVLGWHIEQHWPLRVDEAGATIELRDGSSILTWPVKHRAGVREALTVRTLGPAGVLSRPARLTIVWK